MLKKGLFMTEEYSQVLSESTRKKSDVRVTFSESVWETDSLKV